MKTPILILLIALFTCTAHAQEPIEDPDLLNKEMTVLKKAHPHLFKHATIQKVIRIDDNHSVIQYLKDSVYHETIVNSGRKDMLLLETGKLIAQEELPDIVHDAYQNNDAENRETTAFFKVERPNGEQLYRIDVKENEERQVVSLYYDVYGHPAASPL
jgi:hypothetical protein